MNAQIPLLGIGTNAPKAKQEAKIFKLAEATAAKLGCEGLMDRSDIIANTDATACRRKAGRRPFASLRNSKAFCSIPFIPPKARRV